MNSTFSRSIVSHSVLWGALLSLFTLTPSFAYSVQSLHHSKDLSEFQDSFEEICRSVGPGYNCAYQAYMVDGTLPAQELEQVFQMGMLGKLKLDLQKSLQESTSLDLSALFKGFRGTETLPAPSFAHIRSEMESALNLLQSQKVKRIRGIYWASLSNGNVLLVLLPNPLYGVTEAGLLLFGTEK